MQVSKYSTLQISCFFFTHELLMVRVDMGLSKKKKGEVVGGPMDVIKASHACPQVT